MSLEKAKEYLKQFGADKKVIVLDESSATVELAAHALHCEPARIAKTLSFYVGEGVVLLVTAGDAKIDNKKYKETFGQKAKMLEADQTETLIGHKVGGVCPFGVNEGVEVYLDVSLKRFQLVYPAAGSGNSAIGLTIGELERYSNSLKWVDVCKGWQEE